MLILITLKLFNLKLFNYSTSQTDTSKFRNLFNKYSMDLTNTKIIFYLKKIITYFNCDSLLYFTLAKIILKELY